MPGYEQSQAQLMANVALNDALAQFAQSAPLILQRQLELLAASFEEKKKKPSVFKGGIHLDSSFQYDLSPQSQNPAGLVWLNPAAGVTTAFVIPIAGADLVRIKFQALTDPTENIPLFMAYALTPNEGRNSITIDQFSLVKLQLSTTFNPTTGETGVFTFIDDEIPCSGNKYIHLFGCFDANDLWTALSTQVFAGPLINFSYALIK